MWLSEPRRAASELGFSILLVLNFWVGSQGSLEGLDKYVDSWIDWNTANIPATTNPRHQVATLDASNWSKEAFLKATMYQRRPVLVRGLFKNSTAVQTWSNTTLSRRVGHINVTVHTDVCKDRVIQAIRARKFTQALQCLQQRKFSDFLDSPDKTYAKQVSEMFTEDPTLLKDLQLDRLGDVYAANFQVIPTTFVGKGNSFPFLSSFHCAFAANYFIQAHGRKTWRLVTPDYTPYMQPYINDDVPAIGSRMAVVDKGADEKYRFKDLPVQSITLEAGDFLYIPPWWWHEIIHPDTNWHIGVGLRPVDSVVKQHLPWFSDHWWNTMGVVPITVGLFRDLYIKKLDFAKQYYDNEE